MTVVADGLVVVPYLPINILYDYGLIKIAVTLRRHRVGNMIRNCCHYIPQNIKLCTIYRSISNAISCVYRGQLIQHINSKPQMGHWYPMYHVFYHAVYTCT